jgi:hypothetical protein
LTAETCPEIGASNRTLGGRIARLTALDYDRLRTLLNRRIDVRGDGEYASGHAAAHHRPPPRCDLDATEREDRLFEIRLLRFHHREVQISHRSLVEDDGVRGAIGITGSRSDGGKVQRECG